MKSKILWSWVLLNEAYGLGSTWSQVLRSALELSLPSRSIGNDFLQQSKENKRLDHVGGDPGKACFEEQLSRTQGYEHLRESISSLRCIIAVPVEWESALREHNMAVKSRDLLKEHYWGEQTAGGRAGIMITSFVQSTNLYRLKIKDHRTYAYLLLNWDTSYHTDHVLSS